MQTATLGALSVFRMLLFFKEAKQTQSAMKLVGRHRGLDPKPNDSKRKDSPQSVSHRGSRTDAVLLPPHRTPKWSRLLLCSCIEAVMWGAISDARQQPASAPLTTTTPSGGGCSHTKEVMSPWYNHAESDCCENSL